MIILGINDGHHCGACLFINKELKFALSEERLTRKKNEYGFPKKAINYCLNILGKRKIDYVAVGTKSLPPKYFAVKRNNTFSVDDYLKEQNDYWFKKIYKKEKVKYLKIFKNKIIKQNHQYYDLSNIDEDDSSEMRRRRIEGISSFTKVNKKNIFFIDHHECHAFFGLYCSGRFNKNCLIVTSDGGGDNTNGSVWINNKDSIENVYRTNICNIGRMYRYITLLLGFKPTEHEYKVMGLAGYANDKVNYYDKVKSIFYETLNVKNGEFYYKIKPRDNYFYFKEKLAGSRFDTISFGVQNNTERLFVTWFNQLLKKYKLKDFVFSGGVAQNIKATKKIAENLPINSLFVPPGPGDESIPIGACISLIKKMKSKKIYNNFFNPYTGTGYKISDLNFLNNEKKISVKKVSKNYVSRLIHSGEIVARFSLEQSEFGPRALGNRSILASPSDYMTIHKINKKVKVRDFWMPFAPSLLPSEYERILVKNKKLNHFYMTASADGKDLGLRKITAAIHPFDGTSRPHIVLKSFNPQFYQLLEEFKKVSGIGCLLNTSFNIHGDPIVESPKDAFKTLMKTGLKYLYIGDLLVTKNDF